VLGGSAAAVGIAELSLRVAAPHHGLGAGREMRWFREGDETIQDAFTVDPRIGFRPRLGTRLYNEFGTRPNDYDLEKPAGVTRVLFLGDSVTFRGRILEPLRRLHGEEGFEYWNAGVESFNVVQEVSFYRRFNAAIHPDHVVLSFHNNDFAATPVAFRERGTLIVYAPGRPLGRAGAWLFQHSRVYRVVLGVQARLSRRFGDPFAALVRETEKDLVDLRESLEADGVRMTVLLLPLFRPYADWTAAERRSREEALRLLEGHGFRYFDLLPVMEEASREGVPLGQAPDDPWHPSDALSERIASFLRDQGLLSTPGATADAATSR
jgi:hypothetical protein